MVVDPSGITTITSARVQKDEIKKEINDNDTNNKASSDTTGVTTMDEGNSRDNINTDSNTVDSHINSIDNSALTVNEDETEASTRADTANGAERIDGMDGVEAAEGAAEGEEGSASDAARVDKISTPVDASPKIAHPKIAQRAPAKSASVQPKLPGLLEGDVERMRALEMTQRSRDTAVP